jgi:hypothetical protein
MESVVLRFEPGDMPIELVALRISESGDSLIADLRYTGEKVVTGWKVRKTSVNSSGQSGTGVTWTTDWGASADPRMGPPPGFTILGGRPDGDGPIQPGKVRSVDIGGGGGVDLVELVVSVPVLIFEDASYAGSPREARQILELRATEAEEATIWLERTSVILESTSTERELTLALEELIAEMEGIDDGPSLSGRALAREDLVQDLRYILESDRSHFASRSRRDQVRELISYERDRLDAKIEHIPERLPEDDRSPQRIQPKNIDDPPDGDPGGDLDLDCDCGGSISDTFVRNETIACGPPRGWTVSESWSIKCRNEEGAVEEPKSGLLNGHGGCVDSFCFPPTFCPPEFHGPDIRVDETERIWHRWVRNQVVLAGLCFTTARCDFDGQPAGLEIQCDCAPMPRPRCFADGCPILIETGSGGFSLTGLANGVTFDLTGHGIPSQVAWTRAGGDDAWLVLDRNGNGRIDDATELFGDRTDQPPSAEPHGFLALAVFDDPAHGGDGDGVISAADSVFSDLRLWLDHDKDGLTDLGELVPLASADIAAIELDFFRAERRDNFGNRFRYSAKVHLDSGGHRLATDVFLQFE